jgi:lipopolysaccharide/colanic/teichoic acid biosynthesis glycosyltransferase
MPAAYAAIDICVLPSYREGLPNVALESQAMRVPVVATGIAGTADAVRDGKTGFLVEPRNHVALAEALRPLVRNGQLRAQMGAAGRGFVTEHFLEQRVSALLAAQYRRLLACHLSPETSASRRPPHRRTASKALKRVIDLLAAVFGLAVASPWMFLIGIASRRSTGSTALFRQTRIGFNGQPFTLYKFRTMREARDSTGNPRPDAERLTRFGSFLRSTSLDELPELFNVIRGEMSLVGPRPLLPQYLSRYNAFQRRRHEVKPGITGWVQVNGRNALTWEQKFELDVWYVDHTSLSLDFKILWLTLLTLIRRRGIQHEGHATMPEFAGSGEPPRRF